MGGRLTRPGAPIGLLGGTFDPIHNGHLAIAAVVQAALDLDGIVFIPAGIPPHKPGLRLSSGEDRRAMVALAIATEATFSLSTIELDRPGPSYAVDTLAKLAAPAGERRWNSCSRPRPSPGSPHGANLAGSLSLPGWPSCPGPVPGQSTSAGWTSTCQPGATGSTSSTLRSFRSRPQRSGTGFGLGCRSMASSRRRSPTTSRRITSTLTHREENLARAQTACFLRAVART